MLLAGECHAGTVDSVATNNIEDLSIFLAWGFEGFLAGWNIVEQIFDLAQSQSTEIDEPGMTTVICVPPRPAQGFGSGLCPDFAGANFPSS